MLLIDNNQIILANIFQAAKDTENFNEDYIRHTVLNSYRKYRMMFREYGELVVCNDSCNYWRKQWFPHYKQNRKKTQDAAPDQWKEVYSILDVIRDEIKEIFPYPNIRIQGAEADDIIFALTKRFAQQEKIMILSNDKDFQQLQIFPNVKQYSTNKKELMECADPRGYLLEHIIKGDSSDGVPNMLSDDDTFMTDGKRQTVMTAKRLEALKKQSEESSFCELPNYIRNKTMIDLSCIPMALEESILDSYQEQQGKGREKLFNYFIDHKLKELLPSIEEF